MSGKETIPTETCQICEGTGQVCSFRGVSRFVLTWEDCPVCGGMGVTIRETDAEKAVSEPKKEEKK